MIKNEWLFKQIQQIHKNLVLWEEDRYNGWKNDALVSKDRYHMDRFGEISEEEYRDIKKVYLAGKAFLICKAI
jgi:hypothetical protein